MEIGTVETLEEEPEKKERQTRTLGGGPSSGGNGGGKDPGDGGDDRPNPSESDQPINFVPGISRILTGFLLLVVLMTFGGLIAAYVVIATNGVAEWKPFDLPIPIFISTAIILSSSLAYHLGKAAVFRNDQPRAKRWFIVTTVLGAAFISSQLLSWLALTTKGFYLASNPYAGFFYVLTAVHAAHVLGGIAALGAVLLRTWHPTTDPEKLGRRMTLAQVVGWYWHFMDALWIVLFVLLGFWK